MSKLIYHRIVQRNQQHYIIRPQDGNALQVMLYPPQEVVCNSRKIESELKVFGKNESAEPTRKISEWHDEEYIRM